MGKSFYKGALARPTPINMFDKNPDLTRPGCKLHLVGEGSRSTKAWDSGRIDQGASASCPIWFHVEICRTWLVSVESHVGAC